MLIPPGRRRQSGVPDNVVERSSTSLSGCRDPGRGRRCLGFPSPLCFLSFSLELPTGRGLRHLVRIAVITEGKVVSLFFFRKRLCALDRHETLLSFVASAGNSGNDSLT